MKKSIILRKVCISTPSPILYLTIFHLERAGVHVDMPKMKIKSHSQTVTTPPENNTSTQTMSRTFKNPIPFFVFVNTDCSAPTLFTG